MRPTSSRSAPADQMRRVSMRFAAILLFCISAACTPQAEVDYVLKVPSTFDSLPNIPADNNLTESRIRLGERLFFDKRLSADGNISCGSCHKPALAYADTVPVSSGVHGRLDFRNSPSLLNVGYRKTLFREGGIPNLELQVLAPFGNENEMDFSLRDALAYVSSDAQYRAMFLEAYGGEPAPICIAQALACFQRSLVSSGSRYDAWLEGDNEALSPAEQRGRALFFSPETACSDCHAGFLFADDGFYNVGLYSDYADLGRKRLTAAPEDAGKMATPSLRNVALTPPYMHDGSMPNLETVLRHFNQGGADHPNKDERIRPLGLSESDLEDLRQFLIALTDTVYTLTENLR